MKKYNRTKDWQIAKQKRVMPLEKPMIWRQLPILLTACLRLCFPGCNSQMPGPRSSAAIVSHVDSYIFPNAQQHFGRTRYEANLDKRDACTENRGADGDGV